MQWIILFFHVVVAPFAIVHALLYKRDSRAALGWIGISLFFPVAGPLLYYFFGVNRLRARARELSGVRLPFFHIGYERGTLRPPAKTPVEHDSHPLARAGWSTTGEPLCGGNTVDLLENGDGFYPRLLEDIHAAREVIGISSYIFSGKGIGAEICDALIAATERGVSVMVLVDGVGTLYSLRGAEHRMRGSKVRVARFHPPRLLPPSLSINLRNHRKLAIIDGVCGYYGGLNIDDRHFVEQPRSGDPHIDVHFRAEGPVVESLGRIFARDWHTVTGEEIAFPPAGKSAGKVRARAIEDGPDESMDRLAITLMGVISGARKRVRIVTPYFIPSRELAGAMQAAEVRGVDVQVILPLRSNLRFVDWATRHLLWELLQWGVKVHFVPPPFVHSKLVLVDDEYVLGGSANIDPRSLRLNFEVGVEMFDARMAAKASGYVDRLEDLSQRVSLEDVDRRPLPVRLRDGFFWLFSAYL